MGVHLLNGDSVTSFANDVGVFHERMAKYFDEVDVNHDGLLTPAEFQPFVESLNVLDMDLDFGVPLPMTRQQREDRCCSIFKAFDVKGDGVIDREEFESQLKAIFLAIAEGLGQTPVHMILNESSILKEVVA